MRTPLRTLAVVAVASLSLSACSALQNMMGGGSSCSSCSQSQPMSYAPGYAPPPAPYYGAAYGAAPQMGYGGPAAYGAPVGGSPYSQPLPPVYGGSGYGAAPYGAGYGATSPCGRC